MVLTPHRTPRNPTVSSSASGSGPPLTLVDLPALAVGAESENRVIHSENLAALKAMSATHAGAVRLAYVDPPYNTGNLLEHYPDDREHDAWLAMMRERLLALRPLLAPNGVLVAHFEKVKLDKLDMWTVGHINWPNQLTDKAAASIPAFELCRQSSPPCEGGKKWTATGGMCIAKNYANPTFTSSQTTAKP